MGISVDTAMDIANIARFMLFIGPISSAFDYATYFLMLWGFNAWANPSLFQTGWFVESLFSQTLIVHVTRTGRLPALFAFCPCAGPGAVAAWVLVCAGRNTDPVSWANSTREGLADQAVRIGMSEFCDSPDANGSDRMPLIFTGFLRASRFFLRCCYWGTPTLKALHSCRR